MFYKDDRLALFIDGTSLHSASRALDFEIDYKRLREEFMRRGKLVRAHFYTCVGDADEFLPVKPLIDWLAYNGFAVLAKPIREYADDAGRRKVKGSIGIELATDALSMATHIDHAVIFSGDGDYRSLIQALQREGVRVTIVSTVRTNPPMASDELRRHADNFVDVADLKDLVARNKS